MLHASEKPRKIASRVKGVRWLLAGLERWLIPAARYLELRADARDAALVREAFDLVRRAVSVLRGTTEPPDTRRIAHKRPMARMTLPAVRPLPLSEPSQHMIAALVPGGGEGAFTDNGSDSGACDLARPQALED
jgi:hypothetical protein